MLRKSKIITAFLNVCIYWHWTRFRGRCIKIAMGCLFVKTFGANVATIISNAIEKEEANYHLSREYFDWTTGFYKMI